MSLEADIRRRAEIARKIGEAEVKRLMERAAAELRAKNDAEHMYWRVYASRHTSGTLR